MLLVSGLGWEMEGISRSALKAKSSEKLVPRRDPSIDELDQDRKAIGSQVIGLDASKPGGGSGEANGCYPSDVGWIHWVLEKHGM